MTVRLKSAIRLLPLSDSTRASLAIDGPAAATFNTIVEAVEEGADGDRITLELAAGGLWVPNVGTLTAAANPTNAKATSVLTLTGAGGGDAPLVDETVTIGSTVYTWKAAPTTVAFQVKIGADADTSIDNLIAAINLTGTPGTDYGSLTTIHPTVTAAQGAGNTMGITAKSRGTAGNAIATTETMGTGSWTSTVMAGGTLETVTIGSTVYTLKHSDNLTTAYDVKIGAAATDTLDNLIAAINANGTPGTEYYAGTLVHPTVRAFAGAGDTMVVQTKSDTTLTAVGTLIATTETAAQLSWGAATLADGTNGTNVAFSVVGDAVSCVFSSGYTTVSDFEAALAASATASLLLQVKTAGTTPLYQLLVTDDDFSATLLTGGGDTTESAPTFDDSTAGVTRAFYSDEATVLVHSTAGSGTMTATVKLWGWHAPTLRWYELGTLNNGQAIAESSPSNVIAYAEVVLGISKFTKFAAELAVSGTATAIEVWMDFSTPTAHP